MPIHCRKYNYILHGLQDVTLQSTGQEVLFVCMFVFVALRPKSAAMVMEGRSVIFHGLREVTSERQVISHDPSTMSMVLMV